MWVVVLLASPYNHNLHEMQPSHKETEIAVGRTWWWRSGELCSVASLLMDVRGEACDMMEFFAMFKLANM